MSGKSDKDKQKALQEKHQAILSELLRQEDNKYCVDCDAKGPRWASWNLGVFLCIRCAGIHRNLGVHVSRVKSVNLDTWTPEQIAVVQEVGNDRARAIYEANLPDNFRRPQTDSALEALIRAKYEHKKYIAKDWVPHQVTTTLSSHSTANDASRKHQHQDKKHAKSSIGDHLSEPRSLMSIKNMSESRLAAHGHGAERRDSSEPPGPSKRDVTPDGRRAADNKSRVGTVPTRGRTPERKTNNELPHVELISLESDAKTSNSSDFGSFIGADVTATAALSSSSTLPSTVVTSSAADLADLDIFASIGGSASGGGAIVSSAGSDASGAVLTGGPKQASKDDIMALFGPPQSASNMYGVPGGMYMPRQAMVGSAGGAAQHGIMPHGQPMMPNGMPMMMPGQQSGGVPIGGGPLGGVNPYAAMYHGYQPQMMPPGFVPTQMPNDGNSAMNAWTVQQQQQQQMAAGHTLSNVLWQ